MRIVFLCSLSVFLIFSSRTILALELKSNAFDNQGYIPAEHTCDSIDSSVPLSWNDVPPGVKSFVIICNDPDAPIGDWVHWVIFNIPPEENSLEVGILKKGALEDGSTQGLNDFGNYGYGGPCPPPGKVHRYFFRLYALDTMLPVGKGLTRSDVLKAIEGYIIAEAEIIGRYQR